MAWMEAEGELVRGAGGWTVPDQPGGANKPSAEDTAELLDATRSCDAPSPASYRPRGQALITNYFDYQCKSDLDMLSDEGERSMNGDKKGGIARVRDGPQSHLRTDSPGATAWSDQPRERWQAGTRTKSLGKTNWDNQPGEN